MPSVTLDERIVHPSTPLPNGYVFVGKGDVYKTRNCRKLTHEAGHPVHVVQATNKSKTTLGIRVPRSIHEQVLAEAAATKDARASAVVRRDRALEDKTRVEILRLFPQIPLRHLEDILRHTLAKNSGRVGRTGTTSLAEAARLAVCAHVRHTFTDYDNMLKNGVEGEKARTMVFPAVKEKIEEWGMVVVSRTTKEKVHHAIDKRKGKNSGGRRKTTKRANDRRGREKSRSIKMKRH